MKRIVTLLSFSVLHFTPSVTHAKQTVEDKDSDEAPTTDEQEQPTETEEPEQPSASVSDPRDQPVIAPPPLPSPKKEREGFFKSLTIDTYASHWYLGVGSTKETGEYESTDRFTKDDGSTGEKTVTHKSNWDAVTTDEKYNISGISTYGGHAKLKTDWFVASAKYSSNAGLNSEIGPSSLLDTVFSPHKLIPGLSLRHHDLKFENGWVQAFDNDIATSAKTPFKVRLRFQELSWTGYNVPEEDRHLLNTFEYYLRKVTYEMPRRVYLAHEREVIDGTGEIVTASNQEEADMVDTTKTTTYFPYDEQLQLVESKMTLIGMGLPIQKLFDNETAQKSIELKMSALVGWGPMNFYTTPDQRLLNEADAIYSQVGLTVGYKYTLGKQFSFIIRDEAWATLMGTRDAPMDTNMETWVPDSKPSEWNYEFGTMDLLNHASIHAELVF